MGGGFFERVRKVQTTLNQFHTVCPKIETKFLGKLRNSNVFSAQNQVVSKKKKKKKKKVFTEIETGFSAGIENSNVFSAQNQVVSKKKRSSPKLRLVFRPNSEIQTFEGGLFSYGGGAIFNFSQKIGLKSTKNVRFCILHKPMGGLEPPAPLATLLAILSGKQIIMFLLVFLFERVCCFDETLLSNVRYSKNSAKRYYMFRNLQMTGSNRSEIATKNSTTFECSLFINYCFQISIKNLTKCYIFKDFHA